METTRPMLCPCSPPGRPHPQMRSTMCVGSSAGTLSRTLVTTWAARSSGRMSTREPFRARPMGERPYATITASVMGRLYAERALAISGGKNVNEEGAEQRRHGDEPEDRVHVHRAQHDHDHHQHRQVQRAGDLEHADLAHPLPPSFLDQFARQRLPAPAPGGDTGPASSPPAGEGPPPS